jgi:hypothetical protein
MLGGSPRRAHFGRSAEAGILCRAVIKGGGDSTEIMGKQSFPTRECRLLPGRLLCLACLFSATWV